MPAAVVHALALIKAAAARVNAELGVLDAERAEAIEAAARGGRRRPARRPVPDRRLPDRLGHLDQHERQRGGRPARAPADRARAVHPNDHVNAGQSSNDTFPTAIRLAATTGRGAASSRRRWRTWQTRCGARRHEFAAVVKAGRTHLMDAVPVTLGQEFSGYARQVELGRAAGPAAPPQAPPSCRWAARPPAPASTPQPGFAAAVIAALAEETGIALREADNHFEAQAAQDALVALSGAAKVVAVSLTKICNDLRWMSSGPRAGLGEIHLPDLQPGSSIMPGKVNPVVPEATLMVCAQVIGNDATITLAGRQRQLRAQRHAAGHRPLPAGVADRSWPRARGCWPTAASTASPPTRSAASTWPQGSPAIVTPLNRYIGYEAAAAVAKESIARAPRDPRGRARPRPRRRPASSPRPSSTRRWTCWPWRARPAEAPRGAVRPGHDGDPHTSGACGSLSSTGAAGQRPISTSATAWEWPHAAHGEP